MRKDESQDSENEQDDENEYGVPILDATKDKNLFHLLEYGFDTKRFLLLHRARRCVARTRKRCDGVH